MSSASQDLAPHGARPTLRTLLDRTELGLRLATGAEHSPGGQREPRDRLNLPVQWVHSSDLADPTPFLAPEIVLLTTGRQFSGEDAITPEDYVGRLVPRGVAALGFGTEVLRSGIPEELAEACRRHGLILFEVPYRTPFIALARVVAESIAAASSARRSWALSAQRALSVAALRPEGPRAAVAELARQLDCWVGLYDEAGSAVGTAGTLPAPQQERVRLAAQQLLVRGTLSSYVLTADGAEGGEGTPAVSLQTMGTSSRLRGVLAIARDPLDPEARAVVTTAAAVLGLPLAQQDALTRMQGGLRAGVVRVLLAGQLELARDIAREGWGGLPPSPAVLALTDPLPSAAAAYLEHRAQDGGLFFGAEPDGDTVLIARDEIVVRELVDRFPLRAGIARLPRYADVPAVIHEARHARDRGRRDGPIGVSRFSDLAAEGLLGALGPSAPSLARARLAPLRRHDVEHGTELVRELEAWLLADGRFDTAARELGIHRHTLRSHVRQAEALLGSDLSGFGARAEIWVALLAEHRDPA